MWIYNQANGALSRNGSLAGVGYSGHNEGLNNPTLERVHNVGPIPRGIWSISPFFDDLGGKGPIVARLAPEGDTDTFGRGGFMIHGDNRADNESASHGCIILNRVLRQEVAVSGDTSLQVV